MAVRQRSDVELVEELEAIATAATERVQALCEGDAERDLDLQSRVGEAADRAIAAGLLLASIADAERIGHRRAREELGNELLRRGGARRGTQARSGAQYEYEQAIRACRAGLAHRDVAAAAEVAHGTVLAIVARTNTVFAQRDASTTLRLALSPSGNQWTACG